MEPSKFIIVSEFTTLLRIELNLLEGYRLRNETHKNKYYPHITYYLCEGEKIFGMLIEIKDKPPYEN